jgi:hypothetical protein
MRVSTLSGSLRVTTTSGFLLFGMLACLGLSRYVRLRMAFRPTRSGLLNPADRHCLRVDRNGIVWWIGHQRSGFLYQMGVRTQSGQAGVTIA